MRKKLAPILMGLFAITNLIMVSSCRHETILVEVSKGMSDTIYFDTQVLPIFQNNCATTGCHQGTGHLFALNSYPSIMKEVSAGNPYSSNAYSAITGVYSNSMPPNAPLTESERVLIMLWIEQGAKNNKAPTDTTTKPIDTVKVSLGYACFTRDIQPLIISHCSMCHNDTNAKGDVILTNYQNISSLAKRTTKGTSKLYSIINGGGGDDPMPPAGSLQLLQSEKDSIYSWIKQGATNGNCVIACDTSKHNYTANIWPIINANCYGCHSTPTTTNHNIQLSNYSTISTVAKNGQLVTVITSTGVNHMPQGSSLTSCDINIIQNWVSAGSHNN